MWWKAALRLAAKEDVLNILGGDPEKLKAVQTAIPDPKYQQPAAYIHRQGVPQEQYQPYMQKAQELVEKKKAPLGASPQGVDFGGVRHTDWPSFTQRVDSAHTLIPPSGWNAPLENSAVAKPMQVPGKIQVMKASNREEACAFGADSKWCISDPDRQNNRYNHYRGRANGSTFYFVYDGTRPSSDPLSRVVVDFRADGSLFLTDSTNDAEANGSIAEFGTSYDGYMQYLKQHGVALSQFKADTGERPEVQNIDKNDQNWFQNLAYVEKHRFIMDGNRLQTAQLAYLIQHNASDLINLYLNSGQRLTVGQATLLINRPKDLKTYHRRQNVEKQIREAGEDPFSLLTVGKDFRVPEAIALACSKCSKGELQKMYERVVTQKDEWAFDQLVKSSGADSNDIAFEFTELAQNNRLDGFFGRLVRRFINEGKCTLEEILSLPKGSALFGKFAVQNGFAETGRAKPLAEPARRYPQTDNGERIRDFALT